MKVPSRMLALALLVALLPGCKILRYQSYFFEYVRTPARDAHYELTFFVNSSTQMHAIARNCGAQAQDDCEYSFDLCTPAYIACVVNLFRGNILFVDPSYQGQQAKLVFDYSVNNDPLFFAHALSNVHPGSEFACLSLTLYASGPQWGYAPLSEETCKTGDPGFYN